MASSVWLPQILILILIQRTIPQIIKLGCILMNGADCEREPTKWSSLIVNSKSCVSVTMTTSLDMVVVPCLFSDFNFFFRIYWTCSYPLRLGVNFLLNSPSSKRVIEGCLRMEKGVRGYASESTGSHSTASYRHISPLSPSPRTPSALFILVFSSLEWAQSFLPQQNE